MSTTAEQIAVLQEQVAALQSQLDLTVKGADDMWLLVSATFVFLMQAGFALLEAGSVRSKNTINILFKNVMDAAIGALVFWLLGYGFAFGTDNGTGFIGKSLFALDDRAFSSTGDDAALGLNYASWFFQWAFSATAATIVSGSVAERCKLEAYFVYTAVISAFIYPVIAHWCWGSGWLSAFGDPKDFLFYGKESNNYIDFAGCGVVHMVGGFSGLMGALILGPRRGRFNPDGTVNDISGHNLSFVVLGTVLLWVGWYGFNPGSTLAIVGYSALASKVAVTTTISAASAGVTATVYQGVFLHQVYDIGVLCNCILAGLVGVTASCAVVDVWGAFVIGISSTIVFITASWGLKKLRIDDPVDAFPLHGCCGLWGVLAVGIFGNDDNAAFAGYVGSASGFDPFATGEQFGVQLVGAICIALWTIGMSGSLFVLIDKTIGMRVPEEVEIEGLDGSEHGGKAYNSEIDSSIKTEGKVGDVELVAHSMNKKGDIVPTEEP